MGGTKLSDEARRAHQADHEEEPQRVGEEPAHFGFLRVERFSVDTKRSSSTVFFLTGNIVRVKVEEQRTIIWTVARVV